jgi:hypothetical protein
LKTRAKQKKKKKEEEEEEEEEDEKQKTNWRKFLPSVCGGMLEDKTLQEVIHYISSSKSSISASTSLPWQHIDLYNHKSPLQQQSHLSDQAIPPLISYHSSSDFLPTFNPYLHVISS